MASTDDFEVSVFLTETPTRHSILTKHKHFRDKAPDKLTSNSSKLISETNETPVDVDGEDASEPIVLNEESDEELKNLDSIPVADEPVARPQRRSKRQRSSAQVDDDEDDDSEDLFVASDEDTASPIDLDSDVDGAPPPKRRRKQKDPTTGAVLGSEEKDGDDDKKKMAMDISFEGFAIYGRVLCLVVKKRENLTRPAGSAGKTGAAATAGDKPGGQATMENWISSTQMPNPGAEEVEI